MAIIDDIKRLYSGGSMLMRLIIINIGAFIVLRLTILVAWLVGVDGMSLLRWVELPASLPLLARSPWTLLTYMFAHYDVWHVIFNMLWLYWLGRIFMEFFSPKQLMGVYLLGGWGGAILFLLCFNLLPHLTGSNVFLIGASASVIAIIVATAVYVPDYKIGLLFIGEVALKWVVIVTLLIYLIGMMDGNYGGNIAHIGGALVGAWYGLSIKRGRDITRPLNAMIDAVVSLFNGRAMPRAGRKSQRRRAAAPSPGNANKRTTSTTPPDAVSEEELDRILKKIKDAGYDALTDAERDKLFKVSRRRNP